MPDDAPYAIAANAVDLETGEIKGTAPAATDAGAPWEPSPEEQAAIQAREVAEANGQQPAQQTRVRRERASTGGME